MFDSFLRKTLSNIMNGENSTALCMAGNAVENSFVVPDVDPSLSPADKAETILKKMTLDEKITMIGGYKNLAVHGNERLKLPVVWSTDASAGVRCYGRSTAFPVPIAMTATWNRALMRSTGTALGEECRAKGVSILLGPGVNICRVPTNGRNFEYMGEDPYLAAELVVPYIKGVQEQGVITTVKHFACNNSDYDRHRTNSQVDERTLNEIYFPAFKAAVQKAKSYSVMCAYNPVNGVFASENRYLLTEVLREQWGFKGFVISDWTCVYSSKGPLKAGLDLEMPFGKFLSAKKLKALIKKGTLSEADVDRAVRNLLRVFFEAGVYSRSSRDMTLPEYCEAHGKTALDTAREAIVLLKNERSILPLKKTALKRIAVLGHLAEDTETCGGGSCCVKSYDKVNILDGIRKECIGAVAVDFVQSKNGKISSPEKIRQADAVIICAGYTKVEESEAFDRKWGLHNKQEKLIRSAARLNPNTVVVLTSGSALDTSAWIGDVPAVLHSFFLGQSAGTAVADILFGNVNPSGKLPFTMAKRFGDYAAVHSYVRKPHKMSILRVWGPQGISYIRRIRTMKYREKLMVGYRHFDTNRVEPQFPFGHGLSYTSFSIGNPVLSKRSFRAGDTVTVDLVVTNTGACAGAEVVQLYIRDEVSALPRPEKELKGFEKVFLNPGESAKVS
ncbi:MAG: beta-glucosidase family protein, partial [Spirochaetota bacterium]